MPQNLVIHTKYNGKIKFIIVPENSNTPWKIKALQVIRFSDIETGFQDDICFHSSLQQLAGRQVSIVFS